MAVAPEAEALLRQSYDAFNRRDFAAAFAAVHPEVTWPNAIEGRRETGIAEVVSFLERQARVIDMRMEILTIDQDEDGSVVLRVRQSARFLSDGTVLADDVVQHVYTLDGGRILAVDARDADGNPVVPTRPAAYDV
jgi:ketosteroid isomerase-like protein